ncbi:MAG: diguanylate cyclase [Gemmatimonadaceae bacterium]|nr:diguanylate cyclase [Gemmatimonadaceae bacterium]
MNRTAAPPRVPPRALALSLAALAIPVAAVAWMPDWTSTGAGMLIWLTALIPAFLLSYYRGLRGVAVALSGGMAVITATQLSVVVFEIAEPNWTLLGAIVAAYLGVSIGIAVLAELLLKERQAAEALALVDRLTGLPNRRHVEDALEREFAAAERGRALTVVLFDLDHFKQVNDRHGHSAGDAALRAFAKILGANTRRENLSGRFGGEEFVAVLRDTEPEPALVFAQRVLTQVRDWPLPWGRLTASAGVAHYQKGMGSYEILLGEADRALYRAKNGGRDMVCVAASYEPSSPAVAPAVAPTVAVSDTVGVADRVAPPRIWIIDDDAWMRSVLKQMLEGKGYALWDSGDATEVIERFGAASAAERPDIILTDVIMPVMTGMRMIDQIAKISPDLRVIYMSGYVQSVIDWQGPPASVVAFLGKPIALDVLLEAVETMLHTPLGRAADAPAG